MTTGPAPSIGIAARLAREVTLGRGLAGSLWESWADPAAVAYLRHLAALPDPELEPGRGVFTWQATGDLLVLDTPLLGVIVRGVDAVALAEGLEELGTLASAVTPAAMQQAEREGGDLETLLPVHLRQAVATQVGRWPPGVSYALAEGEALAGLCPLDAGPLRQAQAVVEVQDHRNVIPIRPLPV